MRAATLIVATSLALGAAGPGASTAPTLAHYLVRPDLRLCPSPTCGGAWVRLVNHATTRCLDGRARRECYVASTPGIPGKLWSARSGSILTRGVLEEAGIDGFPGLATLTTLTAWRPAGVRAPRGTTYRVRDNGVRCVTAPCFSLTAAALETSGRRTVSELELDPVGAGSGDLRRVDRALATQGLLVTGTIVPVRDAGPAGTGRALRATQLWLRP